MKRKIFSKLLMGAFLVASVSMFVSCKDYDDDINNLQTQVNSLKGAVDTKEATINGSISTLQSAQTELQNKITALQTNITDLQGKITAGDAATLESAQKAAAEADAAQLAAVNLSIAEGDAATLTAAKQAVEDAKKILEEAIAKAASDAKTAAEGAVAELVSKDSELSAAIVKAQTAADQALAQLENLKSVSSDVSKAKEDISKVSNDITTITANISEITSDLTSVKGSISKVSGDLSDLTAKYNTLDSKMTKAISDITELKTALNGQKTALESLTAKDGALTKAQADITSLLSRVTDLESQMDAVRKTEAGKVAQQITDINTTIAQLSAAHSQFADKATVTTLSTQASALEQSINSVESQINSVDGKYNTISAALSKALRSLVYMPYLYVDGIETIEYPWLYDVAFDEKPFVAMTRQRAGTFGAEYDEDYSKTIQEPNYAKFPKLAHLRDWAAKVPADIEYFGPAWPVQYHMNPSKSTTAWGDVLGWNRRNAEVITRSTAGENGMIKTAEKYADGTQLFSNNNGILTVGLKVDTPHRLASPVTPLEAAGRPGGIYSDGTAAKTPQYDDIIALQVNSKNGGDQDTVITSDYAMIYPEKVTLEGIVWHKYHSKKGTTKVNYDEACTVNAANICHVWDTPREALGVADASVYPDIELYYNNKNGIVLKDLLGVHIVREGKTLNCTTCGLIKFTDADFGRYGLSCEFQLVGYSIDGNITIDSNYAEFTDADENGKSKTGTIRARNVKEDGQTIDTESATSVDREPLVRVFVKRGDRVLLDGYILIHITRQAPQEEALIVDNYPAQKFEWNLCDEGKVFDTNWSQFSYYVLTQKLDNMTKEQFDASYGAQVDGVPDLYGNGVLGGGDVNMIGSTTPTKLADNSMRYDDVVMYMKNGDNFVQCKSRDLPGYVRYYHNSLGTTNHRFEWYLTADELEEYTHDTEFAKLPKTITRYFRYTGKPGAKYPYIYVKMTFDLTRALVAQSGIKEKNTNYWYKYTGADDGFDAVALNVDYPKDGGNTKAFGRDLVQTFTTQSTGAGMKNIVNFTNTNGLVKVGANDINALINKNVSGTQYAKFYFLPVNFEITSQKGVKYTITARRSNLDERWNAFKCLYDRFENDGTYNVFHDGTWHNLHWYSATNDKTYTEHKWGTAAENKALHEKCAIDYTDGVYANNKLYAVTNYGSATAVYTQIATLNQNIDNGTVTLIWRTPDNDVAKEVLNAIGYKTEHKNLIDPSAAETVTDFVLPAYATGELHSMVGVIAHNGCNVAVNITEYEKDAANTNAGTFYISWQRPINVVTKSNPMVDAKNNGDYIYTVDFLKMFDWRGPVEGKMWDANQWLWAYYNIKSLTLDTRPAYVKTNMHQANASTFVPLNKVTTMAQLGTFDQAGNITIGQRTALTLPSLAAYNSAAQNNALKTLMFGNPVSNAVKQAFAGGLFYANNGDNVEEFDVIVPVTVAYDWGEFIADVTVHINRTLGN